MFAGGAARRVTLKHVEDEARSLGTANIDQLLPRIRESLQLDDDGHQPLLLEVASRLAALEIKSPGDRVLNTESRCVHKVAVGDPCSHNWTWITVCGWKFGTRPHRRVGGGDPSPLCEMCWPNLRACRAVEVSSASASSSEKPTPKQPAPKEPNPTRGTRGPPPRLTLPRPPRPWAMAAGFSVCGSG